MNANPLPAHRVKFILPLLIPALSWLNLPSNPGTRKESLRSGNLVSKSSPKRVLIDWKSLLFISRTADFILRFSTASGRINFNRLSTTSLNESSMLTEPTGIPWGAGQRCKLTNIVAAAKCVEAYQRWFRIASSQQPPPFHLHILYISEQKWPSQRRYPR
jgi:hypothetical protein